MFTKNIIKLCIVFLSFISINLFSQTACTSAAAFCANNSTGTTFPAGVNNGSAAAGPDYGCLFSQPNPAWYYFQVSSTGVITIGISGTGGSDVDFICWGPFTSPTGNCGNLTAGNTVDCSYSASATETCTINNAIVGQYYMLLLTNYSNTTQNINFNQIGGSGSTNCNLIAPVTSATICAGQTASITANTTLTNPTFVWQPGGFTTQTITVSPAVTTVYTVTVNGLDPANTPTSVVGTGTVTVTSAPTVAITPSLTSICSGQSQALSASGSGPFVWTASSGANPPASGNVTVNPTTTTTYTVISGTGTCTNSAVATVSVTSTPTIAITPSLSSICSGQSQVLSSSGAGPFVWTASSGSIPPAAATVTVNPITTTTYTVLSGTGACTAQAVATVSITTTPTTAITPTLSSICVGQNQTLNVTGSGPYVWTASDGSSNPPNNSITVSPTVTTTYTVLAGTGACTAQAVAVVSVTPVGSVSVTPSSTNICIGQSVSLTASGAAPFVWSASSGPNPPSNPSINVTPTITTTYTVLSGTGACTVQTIATITVTPNAPINITPSNTTICLGESTNLTTTGTGPFIWTASTGTNPASAASVVVSPNTTTTYTVLSGTGACTAQAVAVVSIAPALTVNINPTNTIICNGGTTTLSASGTGPYQWTASTGSNPSPTSTVNVNPATTTTFTVLIGTGACTAQAVATVSVLPVINPLISAISPTTCVKDTVTLSVANASGLSYTWQPTGLILGASNTSSINAVSQTSANVIYTVNISNGVCSATDTILIKVYTPPTNNNFITLNNDTVCVGGCVTFSATTLGSQPISYNWYYESGVGTSSVGIHPEACYPSAGSFSVMSIAYNACGVDTAVKTNIVTVYDYPVLTVSNDTTIDIGMTANVSATGGVSYYWYTEPASSYNTLSCSTCPGSVVNPTMTTSYIVVALNSPYCKTRDTIVVNVDINCGDFFVPNVFSPNDDGLNDDINVHGRCIQTFNLQIFNRWGEKVFETNSLSNSWDGTFRGKKLDTGVFVYKADGVSIDGQSFKFKGNITLLR